MWQCFICEWQVRQFFLFVQCNQVVKAKLRGPLFAGHGQVLSASVWIIFIAKDFNQKTHSWETRTWASFMCLDLNHLHCKMQPVLVHIHLFTLIEDIFDKVGKSRTWAFKFQVSSFKCPSLNHLHCQVLLLLLHSCSSWNTLEVQTLTFSKPFTNYMSNMQR